MLYELQSQLGYKIRYFQMYDYPDESDEPDITIGIQPDFKGYNRGGDECTVFDFLALADKMNKDACYYPITCECGMPDDTAIDAPLTQKVTDTEIYWDIPIEDYSWTISPEYRGKKGTLRLIFNKQQFQQTVLQMNAEIQSLIQQGIEISTIEPENFIDLYGGVYTLESLRQALGSNSQTSHINVWKVHPYGATNAAKLFIDKKNSLEV